MVIRF